MNPARRSCRGGVRREELPWWSAEALHPGSCSFSGHGDIFEKLRIRGHDDERLRIGVSNLAESCNVGLPRSTIQFREQTMKRRDPDDAGNLNLTVLPQPFRTLLHCGKTIFLRASPLAFPNYDDDIITLITSPSEFF